MIDVPKTTLKTEGITLTLSHNSNIDRKILPDGEYSQPSLLSVLADNWVPLMECHQCGRFSYCKFVERYPDNPERGKEIQCGVVLTTLDNFLLVAWEQVLVYSPSQIQNFLDGLYYFVQFVYETEITIGNLLSQEYLTWTGTDLARKHFGYIAHLRTHLDKFAFEFANLGDFGATGRWFSVEGEAERAFIEKLGHSPYVGGVESYGGKGNVKPSKLKLYLKSLQGRGYSVAIQGDKDGSKTNRFDDLVKENLIERELTFPFTKDFEGSFPPQILHRALSLSGYEVPLDWLQKIMEQETHLPIVRIIEDKIDVAINKVKLACNLADVVSGNEAKILGLYPNNEIAKWLFFLRTGKIS